jgi:trehalose synthase-fused probable maltokinase
VAELAPALIEQLRQQRWFAAKGRTVRAAARVDRGAWATDGAVIRLELVEVGYAEGPPETYVLVRAGDELDALRDPRVARSLLGQAYAGARVPTERGGLLASWSGEILHGLSTGSLEPPRPLGAEQSNSSVRYGDGLVLKLYRRLQPGIHPEVEMAQFLTDRTTFRNMPLLAATLNYRGPDGAVSAVGMFQTFVPNRGDAWQATLRWLEPVLEGAALPPAVEPLRRLGEVTAALHAALASSQSIPAFAPQPVSQDDVAAWTREVQDEVRQAAEALQGRAGVPDVGHLAEGASGVAALVGSQKIRLHGDYHLGQVLVREDQGVDFAVIDFEGEPAKPLGARREKRSPLRDVAGMLRSLDYARHAALRDGHGDPAAPERMARADAWHRAARDAFLEAYLDCLRRHSPRLLPADECGLRRALAAFELEKAAYEVLYELNNRPDWLPIPLAALAG